MIQFIFEFIFYSIQKSSNAQVLWMEFNTPKDLLTLAKTIRRQKKVDGKKKNRWQKKSLAKKKKKLAKIKFIHKKFATKSKNTHLVMSEANPIGKITNG